MTKLAWIALPLIVYAAYAGVTAWRRGRAARHALNVQTSVLLMLYLLATAGLGLFWVANQQLPVFDLHYLFGYATLALVAVHLFFNLPIVIKYLRRGAKTDAKHAAPSRPPRALLVALAAVALASAAFLLGARHGRKEALATMTASVHGVDAIERYHSISSTSRGGVLAEGPRVDWGPRPAAWKSYPEAETIALPPAGKLAGRSLDDALRGPAPSATLDLAALGAILFHTAGVTEQRGGLELRASPSSGALFPTEVYVLARDVAGLPAGAFHYDGREHRLHVLSSSPPAELEARAAIVVTSIFRRTGFKYHDRAYRYATADAGHLLGNLRIAAAEAGLAAEPEARFDEAALAALLGVDGIEEGVLALVPLSTDHATTRPRDLVLPPLSDTSLGATGMVHLATSLTRVAGDEPRVPLPSPAELRAPALEVIAKRRSQRRFDAQPIAGEALSAMMAAGGALAPTLSTAVRVHVVVNRVNGLAPGAYRYDPESHTFALTRAGDLAAEAGEAALDQEVIGGGAAVLVLSVDRRALLAEGPRGYRQAFLEAGMFSERWLLAAAAQSLGACPVGAFYDHEAAALVGVDPAAEWIVHFAAAGNPG